MKDVHLLPSRIVAFVLILSAALKLIELVSTPELGKGEIPTGWIKSLIASEFVLGFWLLSMRSFLYARAAALLLFCVFFGFTILNLASGGENCNCFGVVKIHPAVTMLIDLASIALLYLPRTLETSNGVGSKFVFAFGVILAMVIVGVAHKRPTSSIGLNGDLTASVDSIVLLEPEEWLGHSLPISAFVKGSTRWKKGKWLLVFYRNDCMKCDKTLDRLSETHLSQIAFVQLPPTDNVVRRDSESAIWLQLDNAIDWFIEVPTIIEIHNGAVVRTVDMGTD